MDDNNDNIKIGDMHWDNVYIETDPSYPQYKAYKTHDVRIVFHRVGGPAVSRTDGTFGWYFRNELFDFPRYCKVVKQYMTNEEYFLMVLTYGH